MTRTFTITTALLAVMLTSMTNADTTLVTTPLPGGTSAVGAYTLASVHGQASTLGAAEVSTARLELGYLCIEADDIGNPGDLNHDGHVNGIDLAFVLNTWGICGTGTCVADIDRNGIVDGVDLAIVLNNWG
jgi:Dockerin type I domain